MKLKYFGDSYDIVKKSLIAWMGEFGSWSVHPMFTEPTTPEDADLFARFLGAPLLSTETLTPYTDREGYFNACKSAGNLFLDPDTGVCLEPQGASRSVNHIFGRELVALSQARPAALTLVFDQSFARGNLAPGIQKKLAFFAEYSIHGFAYSSHAQFLVLSADRKLVNRVQSRLLELSGLPSSRLVTLCDA